MPKIINTRADRENVCMDVHTCVVYSLGRSFGIQEHCVGSLLMVL